MTRGPKVAAGAPKAVVPMFWGTRQGVPTIPQAVADAERENWVVRRSVIFARFKTLKASQMNCRRNCSLIATLRVTRGSIESVVGCRKVFRGWPGVRSVWELPSLLRSKFTSPEYGTPDCTARIPLSSQPPRIAFLAFDKRFA